MCIVETAVSEHGRLHKVMCQMDGGDSSRSIRAIFHSDKETAQPM